MLTYSAHAIPGGYAVAYTRPDRTLVAVMDCGERQVAQREADRLNLQQQAAMKAAELVALREHAWKDRSYGHSVRYFPDDEFA